MFVVRRAEVAPCRFADGVLRTFYHADYFRTAERQPGARPLTAFEHEVLDAYDAIANADGVYVEMDFEPSDIQLLSNHTVLHSRSAYEDFDEPARKRHLLRLWLSFPQHRSLRALPSLAREGVRLFGRLVAGRIRKRRSRSARTGRVSGGGGRAHHALHRTSRIPPIAIEPFPDRAPVRTSFFARVCTWRHHSRPLGCSTKWSGTC